MGSITSILGGRFGYFLFSLLGGGEGGVQGDREGVGRFLVENPRGGGCLPGRGEWQGGREGVCREFGGGGVLNIFLSGRNAHQALQITSSLSYLLHGILAS